MNYQERLLLEYRDLIIKIEKLNKFIEMSCSSDKLLNEQLEVMYTYLDILQIRLLNLLIPDNKCEVDLFN